MLADVFAVDLVLRPAEQRRGEIEDRATELRMAQREIVCAPCPAEIRPERLVRKPSAHDGR